MDLVRIHVVALIELGGLFAPVAFIFFHLLRPFLFLPVVFICVTGGILFGPIAGSLYSLAGITLSSILFYGIYRKAPKATQRIIRVKKRLLGEKSELTQAQIIVLRLIPFIHFHLLSICLIEISANFRDYAKASLLSNIPLAFIYTSIGGTISSLNSFSIILCLFVLLIFLYLLRKKEIIIKWQEFFLPDHHEKHTSLKT